ncbi:hypothetical protein PPERSA_06401 [Pseudocohnilembus persalinus]|uniref:Uncharacterized protein n=1 Tax=Pseudocohnilembus persalinus TaxID=266149 RepID=A0A0V0Q8V3_PSEPJ|nr:hypothetical protein PPERSA_06401 [Pseudocohnilembus persalinus]|eukprot:KRW98597.1 hypothetical protein PPERSA_06401 [Pseudocohnilembus persalinus]
MANDNQTEQKGRKNRGFHKPEDDIEIILEDKQNRQKDREMWRNKRRKGDDILDLDDMVNGFNKKSLEDDFVENFETLKDKKGKKDNKKMEQMQKKIRESIKEKEEERLNKKMQLSEKREKRRIQREELKKQIEKAQEQGIFDDELQNKFLDQEKEIEKQEMEDQMEERKIYEEQSNDEMKILKEQAEEMVRHGASHPMDFLLEWEEQLADFSPDEMLSFEINGKEQEVIQSRYGE